MTAPAAGHQSAPQPLSPLEVALDRYLRHLSIERGRSGNTIAAYRRDLAGYLRFLGSRGISAPATVGREDVAAYAEGLASRSEPALAIPSIARMLSSVRSFHRFLADEALAAANVADELTVPKPRPRLPKAITIDQVAAVIAAASGDDLQDLRDKALLELLYATGARISEAVGLNVDDVLGVGVGVGVGGGDGSGDGTGGAGGGDGSIDLVRLLGKGGKQRIVPFGSFARAAIDAYLVRARPVLSTRGKATPALFLGLRGHRLSRQNAWLIIRARAEQARLGIEISPHTFRHSFATHLLAGGADVRVVQELLGHASVSTTQLYTLVTADALRDVYSMAHPRAR